MFEKITLFKTLLHLQKYTNTSQIHRYLSILNQNFIEANLTTGISSYKLDIHHKSQEIRDPLSRINKALQ